MSDVVLEAGGLLPTDATLKSTEPVDAVGARAYRHPALKDRVVVRLSPENLAKGDDLEMEVLGFGAPEDRGAVGKQRRRALGFPGWALVNDPKNARFALEVVKDLKKAARKAKSKPGHAKELIDPLGDQLGRSVPAFLPSFYEEIGRAFIEADAHSYGAQYFEKARDAERVHALAIDEDVRRDAFLEFALAGALAIKSLSAYAKDLEKSRSPAEAFAQFRTLCVRRTLGGMPPWGAMGKELARLAKSAKLDVAAEEARLISEVIESPSLAKASAEFWKSYRKALVALAKADPKVRGALLDLLPDPSPESKDFDAWWLELLDECGALAGVYDANAPAQPNKGPAAWLSRLFMHQHRGWRERGTPAAMFTILEKAAPRILREGAPIGFGGRWQGRVLHVDLTERAFELGLPVAEPPQHAQVDLVSWAREADAPQRGRDPERMANDPRFTALFDTALDNVVGSEPFETVARGKKGLAQARRAWLDRTSERATSGGLVLLEQELARLSEKTSAKTFAEFPDQYTKLVQIDPVRALATSLRVGIFDEWSWPAFEAAIDELDPEEKRAPRIFGAFPYACVTDDVRAIVVGPRGRVLTHDLHIGKGFKLLALRYSQAQLLVVLTDPTHQWRGYWSGAPDEVFVMDVNWTLAQPQAGLGVELADGSISDGGRALRAGDRTYAGINGAISDHDTVWIREWAGTEWKLREVDPSTGEKGRTSLPAFFEGWSRDGMKLELGSSWIARLPEGFDSPFGMKDGLSGLRVRIRDPRSPHASGAPWREMETIDGRTAADQSIGLLKIPGDDRSRGVTAEHRLAVGGYRLVHQLLDPESGRPASDDETTGNRGHLAPMARLPLSFWHAFRPRDADGSAALRAIDAELLRPLVEARATKRSDASTVSKADLPALRARVDGLADDRLALGVLRAIDRAADQSRALDTLRVARDPKNAAPAVTTAGISTTAAKEALRPLLGNVWAQESSLSAQIFAVSEFFGREERKPDDSEELGLTAVDWPQLVGRLGAVAYLAASPATSAEHRKTLHAILDAFAHTVFVDRPSRFRSMYATWPGSTARAFEHGGNDYWVRTATYDPNDAHRFVLEHAASGAFVLPSAAAILREHRAKDGWGSAADIAAFDRTPWAWSETAVEIVVNETGLTRAEAALLLAGFPNFELYGASFLDKDVREAMGLKAAEANAARNALSAVPLPDRIELLAAAWTPGGPDTIAPRLAKVWVETRGRRAPIPEELLVLAGKEIGPTPKPSEVLAALAAPDDAAAFGDDAAYRAIVVSGLAIYVPWLHATLAAGDPIAKNLPRAAERTLARLRSESLLVELATAYFYDATWQSTRDQFVETIGGKQIDAEGKVFDEGRVLATVRERGVTIEVRPARIRSREDWAWVRNLLASAHGGRHLVDRLELIASDGWAAMANATLADGAFHADPRASSPELVDEARKAHDLSEDAAALYLQTLAILAPTAKLVQRWNGWTSARYTKAAKELAAREHVIEAKRERAQRAFFLPGGWEALGAPNPPFETWKAAAWGAARELVIEAKRERAQRAFFLPGGWEALGAPNPPFETWKAAAWGAARDANGNMQPALGRFVPLRPLRELFAQAWERVERGDVPKYEEVGR
jgi:hypothetical protein